MAEAHTASSHKGVLSPVTERLSQYISGALDAPLAPETIEKTKHHVLDTFAAMISGGRLAPGRAAYKFVRTQGGTPEASVVGSDIVTTAMNAALANGMLAHADETDDSHAPSLTHPGCAVTPAALAMAERANCSGADFLKAVALGYDVCARMTFALGLNHIIATSRSSHAISGLFGAVAASAALERLTPLETRYALSYAVQQASGVYCWVRDEGHIEKAFDFGGMPARNAVAAVAMVASGMTGVEDPFFGERNFFLAFSPDGDPGQLIADFGARFEIMNANIKRWSVGSPNQAVLDAIEALLQKRVVAVDDIARVDVEMHERSKLIVDDRAMPSVCAQHLAALMLVDGGISFAATHDVARMRDPAVLALRDKVRLIGNPNLPHALRQAIVTIHLHTGDLLSHRVEAVRGTAQNPMTWPEVVAKASDLVEPSLGGARSRALADAVRALDSLDAMRALTPLLRCGQSDDEPAADRASRA